MAGFIGSPAMNMLEVGLERTNGSLEAVAEGFRLTLDDETVSTHTGLSDYVGRPVVLGLRPEDLEDAALAGAHPGRTIRGTVSLREALGSEVIVHFSVAARQAVTEDVRELAQDVGDDRAVRDLTEGGPEQTTVVGRFAPRSRVREGETIEVSVDMRSLHFFDPETGIGIYDATNGRKGAT